MTETIRTNEKFAAKMLARIPLGAGPNPTRSPARSSFSPRTPPSYITGQVLPVDGGMVM